LLSITSAHPNDYHLLNKLTIIPAWALTSRKIYFWCRMGLCRLRDYVEFSKSMIHLAPLLVLRETPESTDRVSAMDSHDTPEELLSINPVLAHVRRAIFNCKHKADISSYPVPLSHSKLRNYCPFPSFPSKYLTHSQLIPNDQIPTPSKPVRSNVHPIF